MTRDDISGWTWTLGRYSIEFVTVRHWLAVVALWRGTHFICRAERHGAFKD